MDGNGRWAAARHRPRRDGHRAGVETVRRIVEDASDLGIKTLTLYSFSTENWTRPRAEVAALMALMREYIEADLDRLNREGVRIRILGTREGLSGDVLKLIDKAESQTSENQAFNLNIAFNYGGRDEIIRAVQKAALSGVPLEDISEETFATFLDTAGQTDPDLVIRTSGERRVSNFLLWQAAYAEFVFSDVLWPDFQKSDLINALKDYTGRNRRFGASDTTEVASRVTGPKIKPKWSGLGARLLTAVIVVLICLAPFYIGGYVWALLVAIFSSRMMYEWVRMTDPESERNLFPFAISIAGLVIASLYAVQDLPFWAFGTVIITVLIACAERFRRGSVFWTALGLPYVIIPAIVIILLRGSEVGFDTRGFTQVIFITLIVIAADAGAYFGGSTLGGPKLAPKLSPNKTWSGAISGFLAACLIAALAGMFMGLPIWVSIALAAPLVVLSVLGDLFESTVKRRIGVKDTGMLLPGHGGLLDRLDSLMAAVIGGAIIFMMMAINGQSDEPDCYDLGIYWLDRAEYTGPY